MDNQTVPEVAEDTKRDEENLVTDKTVAETSDQPIDESAEEASDKVIDKLEAESNEQKTENQNVNNFQTESVKETVEVPPTNNAELVSAVGKVTESPEETLQEESPDSEKVMPLEVTTGNVDEPVTEVKQGSTEDVVETSSSDQVKDSTNDKDEQTVEPIVEENQASKVNVPNNEEESTQLDVKQPDVMETESLVEMNVPNNKGESTQPDVKQPDVKQPDVKQSDEKQPEEMETESLVEKPDAIIDETAGSERPTENDTPAFPRKKSFENEFENFLCHPSAETPTSDNDSKSSEVKGSTALEPETKPTDDLKKFNQICPEESSNSSWYKMAKNKEPMDINETSLLGDENSNMSIPENTSVVSSNLGEDSRLSFQVDEGSNLSLPEDSSSVPQFAGHQPVFDESANMNPPSNVTFLQPGTPSSVNADTMSESTTPTSKRNRRGTLQQAAEDANEHGHNITAADIFEYQWPQETDADWFILQEQLSVYLDVKSFKRKYPEIFRRVCDKTEKDFLREKGVVTETQSDLGLTALKSDDVHDLMSRDYPSKYKEFIKILHEREKKRIAEKLKELDAPKLEREKMVEYTKKAMKSSSDWNRKMLKERNKERRAYFDMQTFTTHFPKGKYRRLPKLPPREQTAYPISLIPGQFQEYYKKYSPEELKHFPLNSTVINPPTKGNPVAKLQEQIIRRQQQQQQQLALQQTVVVRNIVVEPPKVAVPIRTENDDDGDSGSDSGNESKTNTEIKAGEKTLEKLSNKLKKKEGSSSRETSKEKSIEPVAVKKELNDCHICKDEQEKSKAAVGEELIKCSECNRAGHPSCLDLTDDMVKVIKTYNWQCMECKTCIQCMDPYDEDKMLFCDNCDRGYHTFCVGLKSLPTGKWECKSCTGDTTPIIPLPRPPPKAKRGRKPKYPNGPPSTTSTPAKPVKETPSKPALTPVRSTPRREAKELEKSNPKDPKETK